MQASTTATLTDAQIKALPGTDVELIAAPGAGKMIVPLAAFLIADFAVAYTGIDVAANYPAIWVSHKSSPIYLVEFINDPDIPWTGLTTFLTTLNTFGVVGYSLFPATAGKMVGGTGPVVNPDVTTGPPPGDYENLSLKIGADNSVNFTGGNAANTLTVNVLYTVLDV